MDAKVLKALGEPKRFQLLQLMSARGYCVGALALRSGLSESAVSQHLRVLREAGLVLGVKRGYYTHYRLDKEALEQVTSELQQLLNTVQALQRPVLRLSGIRAAAMQVLCTAGKKRKGKLDSC